MLDLMRQANRRKWFVWIVIMFVVLSFVIAIFAIWGGAASDTSSQGDGSPTWVARVNGQEITPFQLERHRVQLENQYRQVFGDQFDQQAAAFDFDQMALGQLMGQALAYGEAVRLGLHPSASEVAETIVHSPVFQRNGRFIGREMYLSELRGRGYDVAQYEGEVARDLAVDKLRDLVGTLASLSDAEVEETFAQEGQTAEVDYVFFKESDFPVAGEPDAREIEAYFRDHRSTYQTPERRRVSWVMIERDALQQGLEIPETEIQAYYDQNKQTAFTNPDQRRASHILLKVATDAPAEQVEATRMKAEALLARARSGEDFAALARASSEDPGSAPAGGDLQWFGKGRMVPEFEQAAWALGEGQISDLVRTSFGFHIIKVTGARPAGVTPLEEARDQIRQQLGFRKAQELLSRKADEFVSKLAQQSSSFEGTAAEMGLTVKDSGLFSQSEPPADMGLMPHTAGEIFRLSPGQNSEAISTPRGTLFARLVEVKQPEPAPFETVKDRVKSDLTASRSRQRARAAASELAAAGADGFKAAADKKKLEVKSTGEFSRASAPADLGGEVKDRIFAGRAGDLLGPLDAPGGVVVVKLIKRGPGTPEEIARIKAELRTQLLLRKRDEAFGALLRRLQHAATIETNDAALARLQRRAGR